LREHQTTYVNEKPLDSAFHEGARSALLLIQSRINDPILDEKGTK